MDFLDPIKTKKRDRRLLMGYFLFAVLISLGTVILVYLSYGFGLDKKGGVYQNGLLYIASAPTGANIWLDKTSYGKTNNRINIPSGKFMLSINKSGYREWQRSIEVDGGSVQHFDYPLLIPNKLISSNLTSYSTLPTMELQSPDRRWLLVQNQSSLASFSEYDLNTKPLIKPVSITIPNGILTTVPGGGDNLKLVEWSTDNVHILLIHSTPNGNEYILLNRQTPADSINLNKSLNLPNVNTVISLADNKYDQYYVYNQDTKVLYRDSLSSISPVKVLSGVLSYKTYGSKMVLYASNEKVNSSEVAIRLLDDTTNYNIRTFAAGSTYLLDMAQNNGNWFVATGSTLDNRVYVYENPEQTLQQDQSQILAPVDILKVDGVSYIKFSADTTKILANNGTSIETYDDFTNNNYSFTLAEALDLPQKNVTWMDGERLIFVSANNVYIIDYDGTNQQKLTSDSSYITPIFNQNYNYLYTVTPTLTKDKLPNFSLQQTPLKISSDL